MSTSSCQGKLRLTGGVNGIRMDMGTALNSPFGGWIQTHNGNSTDTTGEVLLLQPVRGKVGIGDTSPSYTLDVTGDINFTNSLLYNGTNINTIYSTIASPTFTGTVSGITKGMVGLGNVDNTSDTSKPVSTAQQTALDAKAPLADPTFTGSVGIGTDSPGYKLEVVGQVRATQGFSGGASSAFSGITNSGTITSTGNVGIATTSPGSKLHVYGNQSVFLQGSTQPCIFHYKGTTASSDLKWVVGMNENPAENYSITGFNSAGHILLNPTGNVGIGGTPSYKLDVTGDINFTTSLLYNGTNINTIYSTIASPDFTGIPLAPTANSGTNTRQIATTAFVTTAVAAGGGGGGGSSATTTKQGQVLETLAGTCDGRSITVESGTYTLENAATQLTTASWADVDGSSVTYAPPSGTKQVVFDFSFHIDPNIGSGTGTYDARYILAFQLVIDNTAITSQKMVVTDNHYNYGVYETFRGIIAVSYTHLRAHETS